MLTIKILFTILIKIRLKKRQNYSFKNRRKIGKSKVLLSTKIASLHPVKVIRKDTSPQIQN